ncbi:MAG: PSD1 and planctomycete cytochrome C domain-containing protein [Verrucomicrobiota bacterium]
MTPSSLNLKLFCYTAILACGFSATADDKLTIFEKQIRPALVEHCYECHSGSQAKAGLRLDYRAGWQTGGESGPAIIAGNTNSSLLLKAIRHQGSDLKMPRDSAKLPDKTIRAFEQWIARGAIDPRDQPPSTADAAAAAWKIKLAERSHWWSLQNPRKSSLPQIKNTAWPKGEVDHFILSALEKATLSPSRTANAQTLIRRLSFVLTGLPVRKKQLKKFESAFVTNPDSALRTLVDELLASPHFGEHFARHWMDVVRYTDTYGYEWDNPAKGSWEYRDYLIRSFNDDISFDQLIREQIAGDLLPEPRINKKEELNESLIGPMFYHMGEHRHGTSLEFNGIHQEMVNNKIDAFSKAFLAMTIGCARCHDHKLDAISQHDYYALAGVFMSPRWTTRVIDAPGKNKRHIEKLKKLQQEIWRELQKIWAKQNGLPDGQRLKNWLHQNLSTLKNAKPEDLVYPLIKTANSSEQQLASDWISMSDHWQITHETALKTNAGKFTLLTDFKKPGFAENWITEGDGLTHGYVHNGTPLISLEGNQIINHLLPRGYHSHALSSKLPAAIRLPAQDKIPGKFLSFELTGGEWAGHLETPQNAFQSEAVNFLSPNKKNKWLTNADRELKNGVSRVLTEVTTSSLNPDFPPRTGKSRAGKTTLPPQDTGLNKRSWFSLTKILAHDTGGSPADALNEFATLFTQTPPTSKEDAWQRISKWHSDALNRWLLNKSTVADIKIINWLLENKLLFNDLEKSPEIAALIKQYREIENQIDFPRSVNSMEERGIEPINYRLNVRGNVNEDGPAIHRDFLSVFAGQHQVGKSKGSGRLELAQYLSNNKNPQTARVYVNRIWQWVFGSGLVSTPNDFGKLGGRPSHPELLDWLAVNFMEENWSTKKLIRQLVLSQTFRQSNTTSQAATEQDPDNHLRHHYPTRRLQAEEIRDSLLAVSGRIDHKLYGPPINPPRPAEDAKKRLFSGPVDSHGRRSIYLKMSIMDPPRFLVGFNLPDLKLPTGRRDVTNVPPQALILLNGQLANQMAEHWAKQLISDKHTRPADRINSMFVKAFARQASPEESQRWLRALEDFSQNKDTMNDQKAWTEIAHALFNTKEFIYHR